MPKIKTDRFGYDAYSDDVYASRKGLRNNQYRDAEERFPRTQREKEECFDMYRIDDTRCRRPGKRIANVPKKRNGDDGPQLWYIACIISALGAFCIFVNSLIVTDDLYSVPVDSLTVLMGALKKPGVMPQAAICISAMPLVFLIMTVVFAVMREKVFEKAHLALITACIFVIVMLFYFSSKLSNFTVGHFAPYSAGYSILIEIGCGIALIIVIVCKKVMGHARSGPKGGYGRY